MCEFGHTYPLGLEQSPFSRTPPWSCRHGRQRREPVNPVSLALVFRMMLDEGAVNSQSQLAQQVGLTRARVTQLLNLLKLPLDIIAELSAAQNRNQAAFYTERRLRPITKLASSREQLNAFQKLRQEFLALQ
ncbi:MAG: hypothetical protein ACYSWP_23280 [Planctomycetota bacterium]